MLPLLGAAVSALPSIIGWIGGDRAEARAKSVVDTVCAVTGLGQDAKASDVERIFAERPDLLANLQIRLQEVALEFAREDTARLQAVNETMRAESTSDSTMQRSWRPMWGFISGVAFGVQIFVIMGVSGWAIIADPVRAPAIIEALAALAASMTITWSVALSVLGVAVWKRTEEKEAKLGVSKPGALRTLSGMFGGKK